MQRISVKFLKELGLIALVALVGKQVVCSRRTLSVLVNILLACPRAQNL